MAPGSTANGCALGCRASKASRFTCATPARVAATMTASGCVRSKRPMSFASGSSPFQDSRPYGSGKSGSAVALLAWRYGGCPACSESFHLAFDIQRSTPQIVPSPASTPGCPMAAADPRRGVGTCPPRRPMQGIDLPHATAAECVQSLLGSAGKIHRRPPKSTHALHTKSPAPVCETGTRLRPCPRPAGLATQTFRPCGWRGVPWAGQATQSHGPPGLHAHCDATPCSCPCLAVQSTQSADELLLPPWPVGCPTLHLKRPLVVPSLAVLVEQLVEIGPPACPPTQSSC